ncbi:MAG: flagellar motor switch protein FliN, partial [Planctomycetota bacterium]
VGYEQIFSGSAHEPQPAPSEMASTAEAQGVETLLDQNLELLKDVHMKVKVELGRGRMYLKDILRLGQGSVVELERLAGDPLDIYVNDKVIARGEVLVLNENFCIRITEICDPGELLKMGT